MDDVIIENKLISIKENKLYNNIDYIFSELFNEYIERKQYMDLYDIINYIVERHIKWFREILLKVMRLIIKKCDDETMVIEFIFQGGEILKTILALPPTQIPVTDIQEYYITVGEVYWKMQIYDTAIRIYDDALYIMRGLQSNSIAMLKLILRITKYRERLRQYQVAAQNSFMGYEIAVNMKNEGWTEAFSKHVEDNNLEIATVYTYATQALIWDSDEKQARNNIIRAIQAISEIIFVTNNIKNLSHLISVIISTFKTFRIMDQADNEVINILRMILSQKKTNNLIEISRGLIDYCKLAYSPIIYTIMVISDAGSLVYSKDIDITKFSKGNDEETTLFDDYGKNLYSGLFSAMSSSMKLALGTTESVNSIEYDGNIIMIEEKNTFVSYLICDRETYEIRSNLAKFTSQIDNNFQSMNPMMISSKEVMSDLIEPVFKKYFSRYLNM